MERQNGGRRGTGGAVVGEMIGAGSERRWRWWLKWNVWWLTEAFGWANDKTSCGDWIKNKPRTEDKDFYPQAKHSAKI